MIPHAHAANIATYSDLISDSAPNEESDHTVQFTTKVDIPPGGYIRFTPDPGDFEIPVLDFDIDNVALYVSTSSVFVIRSATDTVSATEDGVSITPGTSGNVEVTLNSSQGIPANARVKLLLGRHTPNATNTDAIIVNPPTTGSYTYTIRAGDGVTDTEVTGYDAIVDNVHVGDIDTHETIPPVRFNGLPTGDIPGTSQIVQISFETNEFAKCRFSTASGTPYASMGTEFSSRFQIIHSYEVSVTPASTTETIYSYFIRCTDDEGNINPDDYEITFTVLKIPTGNPGDTGLEQGGGDATGGGNGGGTGSGSGGSTGGGGSGGGSGGGGGSSPGSKNGGGGGLESPRKAYQSGDGQVNITGYAFPRSKVVILVDGTVTQEVTSDGEGAFAATIDAIARGAYTFGVYGIDKDGVKSTAFATTFTVTGSRVSTLSNINVMPSIKVTPNPVQPGSPLKVTGYTIPNAVVTLENQNDKSSVSLKTFTANSDSNGAWAVDISTDGFTKGTYKVRAKAKQEGGVATNFSGYTFYGVGESASVPRTSDLNKDGKVNLIDFSILLFWWNTDGGASNPPADINQDGKVSLTDFSIMVFNWTG